jgi:magnesium transporter
MTIQETALSGMKGHSITWKDLTWVDVPQPSRAEMEYLGNLYHLHHLELEDCLSKRQLSKIDEHEDYLFILLHFPWFLKTRQVIRPSQVSIFLGKNYLVTVHNGDLKPLEQIFASCEVGEQQRQEILGMGPGYLLYRIVDSLVDDLFPILDKILEQLDEIEDKVFDEKVEAPREIMALRRDIADQRRIVFPLRRIMKNLEIKAQLFSQRDVTIFFSDISDHVDKAWETLEECKEIIDIYNDTDFVLSAEKTNKILAVLTVIFTLSIPATVVGTLYGMNVNLPGGIETGPWNFLGAYTTLFIVLFVTLLPAALMFWLFRRARWI